MFQKPGTLIAMIVALFFFGGCVTTSTVTLHNGKTLALDLTHSDSTSIYGTSESTGPHTSIPREEIADIDFPGDGHIIGGSILTATGILGITMGMTSFLDDALLLIGTVSAGVIYAGIGIPMIVWGMDTKAQAQKANNWEEAFPQLNALPLVFHDGERAHYGLGISGRF